VRGPESQEQRIAAVSRRLEYDTDAAAVIAAAQPAEAALRHAIVEAQGRLELLPITGAHLSTVTAICAEELLDGIRGDLAVIKTARALAAWEKATDIGPEHIRRAAAFALPHRIRRRPSASAASRKGNSAPRSTPPRTSSGRGGYGPGFAEEPNEGSSGRPDEPAENAGDTRRHNPAVGGGYGTLSAAGSGNTDAASGAAGEALGAAAALRPGPGLGEPPAVNLVTDLIDAESSGRRGTGSVASRRATRVTPYDQTGTLAINETLTSAAIRGRRLGARGVALAASDLMQHGRSGPGRSSILFLVDASASMATRRRIDLATSAALGLLKSNYQHRDEVALMVFRGEGADLLVPFTSAIEGVERALSDVPTGGRTPLARALLDAAEILQTRDPALLVIFTDGRANVSIANEDPWQESLEACVHLKSACAAAVVIDCEPGPIILGRARQLAAALGAEWVALSALEAAELTVRIRKRLDMLE
jgi:magnesium chelatase subunit D